jgi:hypothetical protein
MRFFKLLFLPNNLTIKFYFKLYIFSINELLIIMNDIDRKLREKIKLFQDIDNCIKKEIDNNNINNKCKNKEINLPRKIPSTQNLKLTDSKSKLNNNLTNPKTQESKNINLYNFKQINYNSGNNNDVFSTKEHTDGNNKIMLTGGSKKYLDNNNSFCKVFCNDVGDRLYEQGMRSKERLERRKQAEDETRLKNMTPDITRKAKLIMRDPSRFEERLYPSHRVMNNSVIERDRSGKSFDISKSDISNHSDIETDKIYKRNPKSKNPDFKFKPSLNKHSLQMAENFEPPTERLTKKKKRSKSLSPASKSPSRKVDISRLEGLYSQGVNKFKKREVAANEKKTIEAEEYKKYTYKPKINDSPKACKTPPKKQQFVEKTYNWRKNVDMRINKMKTHQEKNNAKELTFKPNTNKPLLKTDEKFIKKNLNQIEDYVNKRRKSIANDNEQKDYVFKKFHPEVNYNTKSTIPKEPVLKTAQRTHSRSNSPDINKSRREMKTENFFKRTTSEDFPSQRNVNNFENNNLQYTHSSSTSYIASIDEDKHLEFLKAVGNLQEKLLNFNF